MRWGTSGVAAREESARRCWRRREIFDPEEFLANLTLIPPSFPKIEREPFPSCTPLLSPRLRNPSPPPLTRTDTEIIHYCPIHCLSSMGKGKTTTSLGEWEHLRCSETKSINKCFVTCGVERAEYYVDSVKRQLHCYYKDPNKIGMKCYCRKSAVLTMSNSEKNPDASTSNVLNESASSFNGLMSNPMDATRVG